MAKTAWDWRETWRPHHITHPRPLPDASRDGHGSVGRRRLHLPRTPRNPSSQDELRLAPWTLDALSPDFNDINANPVRLFSVQYHSYFAAVWAPDFRVDRGTLTHPRQYRCLLRRRPTPPEHLHSHSWGIFPRSPSELCVSQPLSRPPCPYLFWSRVCLPSPGSSTHGPLEETLQHGRLGLPAPTCDASRRGRIRNVRAMSGRSASRRPASRG